MLFKQIFHTPAEHFSHPILKFEPVIDFDGQQLLPSSFVKIYAAVISCVPPSCSVALTAVHILNLTVFPLHYFSSFNRLYKSLLFFFTAAPAADAPIAANAPKLGKQTILTTIMLPLLHTPISSLHHIYGPELFHNASFSPLWIINYPWIIVPTVPFLTWVFQPFAVSTCVCVCLSQSLFFKKCHHARGQSCDLFLR